MTFIIVDLYLWTSCWTPWSRWCRHHWLRESWTEAAELWGGEQWPGEEHTQWPSRLPSPGSRTHTWPPEFQHRTPGDRGEQVLPESLLSSSIAVFVISSSWWLSPHFLSNTVPHFTKLVLKRLLHRIIIKFVCCTLSHFKSVKIIFYHEDEMLYCSYTAWSWKLSEILLLSSKLKITLNCCQSLQLWNAIMKSLKLWLTQTCSASGIVQEFSWSMMMRYRVQVLKIENPYNIKMYQTILMFLSNTSIISAVHTKKLLWF